MSAKGPQTTPIRFRIPVETKERLVKYQGEMPLARVMTIALEKWLDREQRMVEFSAKLDAAVQGVSVDA